jgi:hypothetical protein
VAVALVFGRAETVGAEEAADAPLSGVESGLLVTPNSYSPCLDPARNAITTSKTAQSKPSPIIANFAMLGLLSLKVLLSKISHLNSINSIG